MSRVENFLNRSYPRFASAITTIPPLMGLHIESFKSVGLFMFVRAVLIQPTCR